jgi:acetyl esterase/lipase
MSTRPTPFPWGQADPMTQPATPIWPGEAPGWKCAAPAETIEQRNIELNAEGRNRAISGVTCPHYQVFLPASGATGVAVVVFPGGGYQHLAIDKEGYDIARWLNSLGIAGIVATYRVGERNDREQAQIAGAADARRIMRIVRAHAAEWGIAPNKIGAMGFSAGGFMTLSAGTIWEEAQPDAADPVERVSSRPDFIAPLYSPAREPVLAKITAQTPPTFIVQACDDFLPVEGNANLFLALRKAKAPVEIHLYVEGGHGFGLGVRGGVVASWPGLFAAWVKTAI